MHNLAEFRLEDMLQLGAALRQLSCEVDEADQIGAAAVNLLYDRLRDGAGDHACALVRLYQSFFASDLAGELAQWPQGRDLKPKTQVLKLVGTAGERPDWNSPKASLAQRLVPLISPAQVGEHPMFARMLIQFGLMQEHEEGHQWMLGNEATMELARPDIGVFHVIQALGSPYIPDQDDLVRPHGVASVLGCGGVLPGGHFFAVLIFSKVTITTDTAELFKSIALSLRTSLLRQRELANPRTLEARLGAAEELLNVLETSALTQTRRLKEAHDIIRSDSEKRLQAANLELQDAQARLIAKERLASLGALTAGIAHEIRNPLNFVVNFAELSVDLTEEIAAEIDRIALLVDPETRANLLELFGDLRLNMGKIRQHAHRADNIVKTMLLHARGTSASPSICQPNKIVEENLNLSFHAMRGQHPGFQAHFSFHGDSDLKDAELVAENFGRVILNLITNAFQAVAERAEKEGADYRPSVVVSTRDFGESFEVRVRDNGLGIPDEIRKKIFDPFFTTKAPGVGTGQGLSISNNIIVGEHGGEILVESIPGEFAEFIVRLNKTVPKPPPETLLPASMLDAVLYDS